MLFSSLGHFHTGVSTIQTDLQQNNNLHVQLMHNIHDLPYLLINFRVNLCPKCILEDKIEYSSMSGLNLEMSLKLNHIHFKLCIAQTWRNHFCMESLLSYHHWKCWSYINVITPNTFFVVLRLTRVYPVYIPQWEWNLRVISVSCERDLWVTL